MLFSPKPDLWICSKHSRSLETFEDSFQSFSTSTWNLPSVGHAIRSFAFREVRQIGHIPDIGVCQQEMRHSLHILCTHGVSTGSSADSMHMGHSVFSPLRMPSTTSSMYAGVGADCLMLAELAWRMASTTSSMHASVAADCLGVEKLEFVSTNLLAYLFNSSYRWISARLHVHHL